jgi:4a-hydroxytetrahydrobiopterin dehydratase
MASLSPAQVKRRMKSFPLWIKRGLTISRQFPFEGFMDAVGFVKRVARAAEEADHHPDIDIRWNKVTLALTTHSEGGLTAKDFSMARRCDAIFSPGSGRRKA